MANAHTSREKRTSMSDLRTSIEKITHAKPEHLRDGYLSRLRRLLRLRRDHVDELNEQGLRLLDRSIFAAYVDCIDINQGDAARAVLTDVRLTLSLSRAGKH